MVSDQLAISYPDQMYRGSRKKNYTLVEKNNNLVEITAKLALTYTAMVLHRTLHGNIY